MATATPGPPAGANPLLGPDSRYATHNPRLKIPDDEQLLSVLLFLRGFTEKGSVPAVEDAFHNATIIERDYIPGEAIPLRGNNEAVVLLNELDILIRLMRRITGHFDIPDPLTATDISDDRYSWLSDALRNNFGDGWCGNHFEDYPRKELVERAFKYAKFWAKTRRRLIDILTWTAYAGGLTEYRRAKHPLVGGQWRDLHEASRFTDTLAWIHQANPIEDSYVSEITGQLFQEPDGEPFDNAMKSLFLEIYGVEWTVFRDIRNFIKVPGHPSASRLFRWVVGYLIRFHRWREDRMAMVREATDPKGPRAHLRTRIAKAFEVVNEAYEVFCEILRTVTGEMKAHSGISEHNYTLLSYAIIGLTALVRGSKVNKLDLGFRSNIEYGDPTTFPNWGVLPAERIYPHSFYSAWFNNTMTDNLPALDERDKIPDPPGARPKPSDPGRLGKLGGPDGPGGRYGFMGPYGLGGPDGPDLPANW
ncbi:hypothetical protein F4680DRAFT_449922 [Xylaria scruposa]|nr:hypothetical protein F4680DRAFT_449922 [Xylaria scruposa]